MSLSSEHSITRDSTKRALRTLRPARWWMLGVSCTRYYALELAMRAYMHIRETGDGVLWN